MALSFKYPDHVYDLHSHTTASDGLLQPSELIARAHEKNIHALAITDHDTIAGLAEARQANATYSEPLNLIAGVEISTSWHGYDIHIVGLNVDDTRPEFLSFLEEQQSKRHLRACMIGERLEKSGIQGAYAGAQQLAQGTAISRAHFARWLISKHYAKTMQGVFAKYLSRGKTGYVPNQWCSIEEAVAMTHASGGVAVLAHPARYKLKTKWLKKLLNSFKKAQGDAIEVISSQQSIEERVQLIELAQHHKFSCSLGSDFHQETPWIDLGRNLHQTDHCTWIWQTESWHPISQPKNDTPAQEI